MGVIAVLPESVSSKIAAGEVIERPASVVKELVENSIDADATRIDVHLEDGGRKLIRVADDGVGMGPDDLEAAFLSHATSKLRTSDDLFHIATLGFRGEALWSIAAVSHARIVSRPRGAATGWEIEARGGAIGRARECGAAEGTIVEVRNLFFNTPVRCKFLRSTPTEMSHVTQTLTRVALAHERLHFTLTHNAARVLSLPPCQTLRERVAAFFGQELADNLLEVDLTDEKLAVRGLAGKPEDARGNTKAQYVFLNGRYIQDRAVSHAISQAYQGLLPARRYPVLFLFLDIEPSEVDVNVHPTKVEVRFRRAQVVHSQVYAALTQALRQADLIRSAHVPSPTPAAEDARRERREEIKQSLAEFFERQARRQPRLDFGPPRPAARPAGEPAAQPSPPPVTSKTAPFFQVHGSYIVEERPDGVNIIDQHALHERLLFERFKRQRERAELVKQPLLTPEMVELTPDEFFRVMALKDQLAELGVEIEEFGGRSVIVRAAPAALNHAPPAELLKDLLAEAQEAEAGRAGESVEDALLKVMACKAAVKAGQRLSPQEIAALLEQRDAEPDSATCPHGRPHTIFLSLAELEKQFHRR